MRELPIDPVIEGGTPSRKERRRESPAMRALRGQELEQLVAEVRDRIRTACAHLSVPEFDELVYAIARMHLRFRQLEARYLP